jgi:hypothetical protein
MRCHQQIAFEISVGKHHNFPISRRKNLLSKRCFSSSSASPTSLLAAAMQSYYLTAQSPRMRLRSSWASATAVFGGFRFGGSLHILASAVARSVASMHDLAGFCLCFDNDFVACQHPHGPPLHVSSKPCNLLFAGFEHVQHWVIYPDTQYRKYHGKGNYKYDQRPQVNSKCGHQALLLYKENNECNGKRINGDRFRKRYAKDHVGLDGSNHIRIPRHSLHGTSHHDTNPGTRTGHTNHSETCS